MMVATTQDIALQELRALNTNSNSVRRFSGLGAVTKMLA